MSRIAVIVAARNDRHTIEACLRSLLAQRPDELVVVDASTDGTADLVAACGPAVRHLCAPASTLTPVLWQMGYEATAGNSEIVAFTIAQCIPHDNWLAQIRDGLTSEDSPVAGVGGPIAPPERGGWRDWALYFSRYSAFLPEASSVTQPIAEIAGDNAAYQRAALEACAGTMQEGFWETLVHACLRSHGRSLQWQPQMQVRFGRTGSLREVARLRFRHGRHYAATRPGNTPLRRLLRLLTAPALPFLLLARIAGRVNRRQPAWRRKLLGALPALWLILLAWSWGEMAGYLSGRP